MSTMMNKAKYLNDNLNILCPMQMHRSIKTMFHLGVDYFCSHGKSSALTNVTLELTYNCNLNCHFCFLPANKKNQINFDKELSLSQIKSIVDKFEGKKVLFFLTGGEPFLRDDCLDTIEYIKSKGFICGINSNATKLSYDVAKRLRQCKLDFLIVSLHGIEITHDKICSLDGCFDLVKNNLKNFIKNKADKTKVIISCTIDANNIDQLPDLFIFSKDIEADGIFFQHTQFIFEKELKNHIDFCQVNLSQNVCLDTLFMVKQPINDLAKLNRSIEIVRTLAKGSKCKAIFKPNLNSNSLEEWYNPKFRFNRGGRCFYLWTDLRICPNGDVVPCQPLQLRMGNVIEEDVMSVWNNEKFRKLRMLIKANNGILPGCVRCCKLYRVL